MSHIFWEIIPVKEKGYYSQHLRKAVSSTLRFWEELRIAFQMSVCVTVHIVRSLWCLGCWVSEEVPLVLFLDADGTNMESRACCTAGSSQYCLKSLPFLFPFLGVWPKAFLSDSVSEKYMGKLWMYLEQLFGLTCMGTALLHSSRIVLFWNVGLLFQVAIM